jgi:hypothetical protein
VTSLPVKHEEASHCHNCGAAVNYHYCALCGQETKLHVPSAGEFIHEFIAHYVALEGRLWKTLANLLFKPGFLTAEYIAGRRVRYVEPLRVYLTLSILFFALLKFVGPPVADFDDAKIDRKPVAQAGAGAKVDHRTTFGLSDAQVKKFDAFWDLPGQERTKRMSSGFYSYVPYALFCLMPVFALYLKLLYMGSGRRYGEHLLFALHTNAFAFAMFGMLILVSFIDIGLLTFALVVWLLIYLPKAMRRVYGGSRPATFARWLVLSVLHVLSIGGAILAAFGLAIIS